MGKIAEKAKEQDEYLMLLANSFNDDEISEEEFDERYEQSFLDFEQAILELVKGCEPENTGKNNYEMVIFEDCCMKWKQNLSNLAKGDSHDEGNAEVD